MDNKHSRQPQKSNEEDLETQQKQCLPQSTLTQRNEKDKDDASSSESTSSSTGLRSNIIAVQGLTIHKQDDEIEETYQQRIRTNSSENCSNKIQSNPNGHSNQSLNGNEHEFTKIDPQQLLTVGKSKSFENSNSHNYTTLRKNSDTTLTAYDTTVLFVSDKVLADSPSLPGQSHPLNVSVHNCGTRTSSLLSSVERSKTYLNRNDKLPYNINETDVSSLVSDFRHNHNDAETYDCDYTIFMDESECKGNDLDSLSTNVQKNQRHSGHVNELYEQFVSSNEGYIRNNFASEKSIRVKNSSIRCYRNKNMPREDLQFCDSNQNINQITPQQLAQNSTESLDRLAHVTEEMTHVNDHSHSPGDIGVECTEHRNISDAVNRTNSDRSTGRNPLHKQQGFCVNDGGCIGGHNVSMPVTSIISTVQQCSGPSLSLMFNEIKRLIGRRHRNISCPLLQQSTFDASTLVETSQQSQIVEASSCVSQSLDQQQHYNNQSSIFNTRTIDYSVSHSLRQMENDDSKESPRSNNKQYLDAEQTAALSSSNRDTAFHERASCDCPKDEQRNVTCIGRNIGLTHCSLSTTAGTACKVTSSSTVMTNPFIDTIDYDQHVDKLPLPQRNLCLPDIDDISMSDVFKYINFTQKDLFWSYLSDTCFVLGGIAYVILSVWDCVPFMKSNEVNYDDDDIYTLEVHQQEEESQQSISFDWDSDGFIYSFLDRFAPAIYVVNAIVDLEWSLRIQERNDVKRRMKNGWNEWRTTILRSSSSSSSLSGTIAGYTKDYDDDDINDELSDDDDFNTDNHRQSTKRTDTTTMCNGTHNSNNFSLIMKVPDVISTTTKSLWQHDLRKHAAHRRSIFAAITFGVAAMLAFIATFFVDEYDNVRSVLDRASDHVYVLSAVISITGKRGRPWLQSEANSLSSSTRSTSSLSTTVTNQQHGTINVKDSTTIVVNQSGGNESTTTGSINRCCCSCWLWQCCFGCSLCWQCFCSLWNSPEKLEDCGDLLFFVGCIIDATLGDLHLESPFVSLFSSLLWLTDACLYFRSDVVRSSKLYNPDLEDPNEII